MITNLPILNRAGALPDDGWVHIVPKGVFPVPRQITGPDGKEKVVTVQQVLDDASMTAMLNRFNEDAKAENFTGIRLDFEHFSYDTDKLGEAAGWIKEIANRENGLWAKIEWSDIGTAAVTNKRYKLLSPVWLPKDCQVISDLRVRPLRLDSVGLTNNPNLKGMVPLSNRDANASAELPQQKDNMQKIATALGLPADASEETILAKITELMGKATEAEPMKNRISLLQAENKKLLEAQVDTDLAPLKNRVSEEQLTKFRTAMIANRDLMLPTVEALKETLPAAKEEAAAIELKDPITNRASAKTPNAAGGGKGGSAAKVEEHPFLNRAKKMVEGGKLDFVQATEKLAKEEPALFEDYMNKQHGIE
jgi:phage I-like protein